MGRSEATKPTTKSCNEHGSDSKLYKRNEIFLKVNCSPVYEDESNIIFNIKINE